MGTNFYVKFNICDKCGRFEELHLGKSSVGWKFLLQANDFKHYKNWGEMQVWLKDKQIFDEYGRDISLEDFIEWVENRQATIDPEHNDLAQIVDGYKFYNNEFS